MTGKRPGRGADQFPLRLPDGLRERIKMYADYKGRSMNAEILRVLEREFPEPWEMGGRVSKLMAMLEMLKAGASNDTNIEKFTGTVEETVEGIISGRVRGVDDEARKNIEHEWIRYQEDLVQYDHYNMSLDDVETRSLELTGKTEKFVWPDGTVGPERPKPVRGEEKPRDHDDPDFPE